MPLPLGVAAGAVTAAVVGATQDCEGNNDNDDDKSVESKRQEQRQDYQHEGELLSDNENDDNAKKKNSWRPSVRFRSDAYTDAEDSTRLLTHLRQQRDGTSSSSPLRVVRSISSDQNTFLHKQQRTGSIFLKSTTNSPRSPSLEVVGCRDGVLSDDDDETQQHGEESITESLPSVPGFVDGNFASGKVLDINLDAACFVLSYVPSSTVDLLAVGLRGSLDFYETAGYTLVHRVQRDGMVSALRWLPLRQDDDDGQSSLSSSRPTRNLLLAVGHLDGIVSLFRVDVGVLEFRGPTLLHEFQVNGQVRALDCAFFGKLEPSILLAVGDKTGRVSFSSYSHEYEHIGTSVVQEHPGGGVLAIAVHSAKRYIAVSTKTGHVIVHSLHRDYTAAVRFEKRIWCIERNGPVRSVAFSRDGNILAIGGYDKTVALIETSLWAILRELRLQGTINTISFDPIGRYLAVGCRDKTFTLFDTSTYVAVKTFHAPGWVTSFSWGPVVFGRNGGDLILDTVAVRSENRNISVLDLSPIGKTNIRLSSSSRRDMILSSTTMSWSCDGRFLARGMDSHVAITETTAWSNNDGRVLLQREEDFDDIVTYNLGGGAAAVQQVAFSPCIETKHLLSTADGRGYLTVLRLQREKKMMPSSCCFYLETVHAVKLQETNFMALAWSRDGKLLATGGRGKVLHIFHTETMDRRIQPMEMPGRIWDIAFGPQTETAAGAGAGAGAAVSAARSSSFMAVALGDYTTIVFNEQFEPSLQISRSRTVRCVCYHPMFPILAIGDGAGTVAIVDYDKQEVVHELNLGGRVNCLEYSPVGDFLAIGTDDCQCTLHETKRYQCVQEMVDLHGFTLEAKFSPAGMYLSIGTAPGETLVYRLGPFLGTGLIPLGLAGGVVEDLPLWALHEALYRSGNGPTFIQRHMMEGTSDNLRRVGVILRQHPDAIYSFNRKTEKGCFDTALLLKKPNLLKLAVTVLVDGTLDAGNDGKRSILTTNIPIMGKASLADIVANYPSDFSVDIFKGMTFLKVPFTEPRAVDRGQQSGRASESFMDPWKEDASMPRRVLKRSTLKLEKVDAREDVMRTPAVLPLPGLGNMSFLSSMLANLPPSVFDNEAMALVLRVMWRDHIRKYFLLDFFLFVALYTCWILFVEWTAHAAVSTTLTGLEFGASIVLIVLNTLFGVKELVQSGCGKRPRYFKSMWNAVDVLSIPLVYIYVLESLLRGKGGAALVPLAVITTLLLTAKLLSYLRGFADTGWLISVLIANFRDVRGFLIILFVILTGFAVAFRLLFGETGGPAFESLKRSFLSTFELTIIGEYEPELLYEARYSVLAVLTFLLAVTCVLVVALNALISILADSYARVQENATANRRKEQAELIVEYMSLLPPWKLRRIEKQTAWFHTLLAVDSDGDLLVHKDGWEGGLNALRRDMEQMMESSLTSHQKALDKAKQDLDFELTKLRNEVVGSLAEISADIRRLQKMQPQAGITFSGKNVAKAVRAVKSIGEHGKSALFGKED